MSSKSTRVTVTTRRSSGISGDTAGTAISLLNAVLASIIVGLAVGALLFMFCLRKRQQIVLRFVEYRDRRRRRKQGRGSKDNISHTATGYVSLAKPDVEPQAPSRKDRVYQQLPGTEPGHISHVTEMMGTSITSIQMDEEEQLNSITLSDLHAKDNTGRRLSVIDKTHAPTDPSGRTAKSSEKSKTRTRSASKLGTAKDAMSPRTAKTAIVTVTAQVTKLENEGPKYMVLNDHTGATTRAPTVITEPVTDKPSTSKPKTNRNTAYQTLATHVTTAPSTQSTYKNKTEQSTQLPDTSRGSIK